LVGIREAHYIPDRSTEQYVRETNLCQETRITAGDASHHNQISVPKHYLLVSRGGLDAGCIVVVIQQQGLFGVYRQNHTKMGQYRTNYNCY
jgi:hypothetical protein